MRVNELKMKSGYRGMLVSGAWPPEFAVGVSISHPNPLPQAPGGGWDCPSCGDLQESSCGCSTGAVS